MSFHSRNPSNVISAKAISRPLKQLVFRCGFVTENGCFCPGRKGWETAGGDVIAYFRRRKGIRTKKSRWTREFVQHWGNCRGVPPWAPPEQTKKGAHGGTPLQTWPARESRARCACHITAR